MASSSATSAAFKVGLIAVFALLGAAGGCYLQKKAYTVFENDLITQVQQVVDEEEREREAEKRENERREEAIINQKTNDGAISSR